MFRLIAVLFLAFAAAAAPAAAQTRSPAISGSDGASKAGGESLEQLLDEARDLFIQEKSIDARSKLLKALELAPNDYRPHMHLGEYYLIEVAHFRLAFRYLRKAEELFEKQHGSDYENMMLDGGPWQDHANLLYLLAEARLNLDNYKGALETLDRFAQWYWRSSYPGTRAWVLMKLKRVDEAIRVAQAGLLRGAESGRTFNILGILMSVKHSRQLSLDAFARAIEAERALGRFGQPATPLNNAGEVYREMFQDDLAEASWIQALSYDDGCDHILPSLNLAVLYMDELRLFQAERVLDDFEACFAAKSIRSDTEHRALLAMARGRLALRKGDPDTAIELLTNALERQQWFGKIGTNANDVQFSVLLTLAQASAAKAAALSDRLFSSVSERVEAQALIPWLKTRAWWLNRRARNLGIDELDGIEDLEIRNTDTMLEYPTLGIGLSGLPFKALKTKIERFLEDDRRKQAAAYYDLYLGTNLLEDGDADAALSRFARAKEGFREIDRMARAELLARTLHARRDARWFWSSGSAKEQCNDQRIINELFSVLPSHVRYNGFYLPVLVRGGEENELTEEIAEKLLSSRFTEHSRSLPCEAKYQLVINQHDREPGKYDLHLHLEDRSRGAVIAQLSKTVSGEESELNELTNEFVDRIFSHRSDPPPTPLPKLEILAN